MSAYSVVLGDREIPIPRFSVYKATEAIGLVSGIVAAYPELIERIGDYQERHASTVPLVRDGEIVKDESGEIVLTTILGDFNEALAHVLPDAYELARGKVLDLLALIVTSNEDLERADLAGLTIHRNGGPEWATVEGYKAIAHGAEVQQLGKLLLAAKDVLREQLEAADPQTRQAVEALLDRLPRLMSTPTPDEPEPESSDSSANTSRGRAKSSSTGSRGKKPSTSPES